MWSGKKGSRLVNTSVRSAATPKSSLNKNNTQKRRKNSLTYVTNRFCVQEKGGYSLQLEEVMGIIAIDSGLDLLLQVFENFHCGSCASAHLCESLLAYPKETFLVYRLLAGSKMDKNK